jgi:hypothetical protein
MALLQVTDFPQELYDELNGLAKREHRSVPQEAVSLSRQQDSYFADLRRELSH